MRRIKVRIKRDTYAMAFDLPAYETLDSAGLDLRSSEKVVIAPHERALVSTGLYIEIPAGFEAQIRPRSGLALKYGITVLNAPGTIDSDYRGEIGVILINLGDEEYLVNAGDRIAQMVISPIIQIEWDESNCLSGTERGSGGFGSTGSC